MYYVYILRCSDDSLYCGITINLEKRVKEHNSDTGRGAKYLRAKKPVTLVYSEEVSDKSQALKRELEIKKMGKRKKEELVRKRSD